MQNTVVRQAMSAVLLVATGCIFQTTTAMAVSSARYHGGAGDGWDYRQATPVMYQGGAGSGAGMAQSADEQIGNISKYPESLRFTGQPPSSLMKGIEFSWPTSAVPLSVEVLDNSGNRFTNSIFTITLSIDTDPAGGSTLNGSLTAETVDGLASFESHGLWVNQAGVGFVLKAQSAGLVPALSEAFTVNEPFAVTAPAAGNNWAERETHTIAWTSASSAAQVKLYYALMPNSNVWYPINNTAIGNPGSYSWTLPMVLSDPQSVPSRAFKVKVADAAHLASYSLSSQFNIIEYQITFILLDYYNGNDLSDLSVDCTSGWGASHLSSGITRYYPYGTYNTTWSKNQYFDKTLSGWTANSNQTITLTMTLAAPSYEVKANFTHEGDAYVVNAWLEESGKILTNAGNCNIHFEDKNGSAVDVNGAAAGTDAVQASPNAGGFFRVPIDMARIEAAKSYFARIEISYNGAAYSTSIAYGQGDPNYSVKGSFTAEGDTHLVNAWIENNGTIVTNSGNCLVRMENKSGTAVDINGSAAGTDAVQASPNAGGFFRVPFYTNEIDANGSYFARLEIGYNGATYLTSIAYERTAEGGMGGTVTNTVSVTNIMVTNDLSGVNTGLNSISNKMNTLGVQMGTVASAVNDIDKNTAPLGTKLDATLAGIDAVKSAIGVDENETLYAKAGRILTAAETNIPARIVREAKKGVQSKILNRPTTANAGSTVVIRYKTDSGKTPRIMVYDAANVTRIADGVMTNEIAAAGIYEYSVMLDATWGTGEFTVICSEAETASADSMILNVSVAANAGGGAAATDLTEVVAKLDSLTESLNAVSVDIDTIQTTVTAINTSLESVSANVSKLIEKWGVLSASDIMSDLDTLVAYMGTPFDASGKETVFGKIADVYGQTKGLSTSAIYSELQSLRKEVDFNGKSETAFTLMNDINEAVNNLMDLVSQEKPAGTTGEELTETSAVIEQTKELIKEKATQAGLKGALPAGTGKGAPEEVLTLQKLHDEIGELRAMTKAILELMRKKEQPIIKSWLEAGSVKSKIFVVNPSATEAKTIPVKSYLPSGFKPEDMIEKGQFELSYDFEKALFYVHQDVRLEPNASVTLEVVMRDVWTIEPAELETLREHVGRMTAILEKSTYAAQVKSLSDSINRRLDRIVQIQNMPVSTENKLSNYAANQAILNEVKNDMGMLEDLVIEVVGLPTDKIKGEVERQFESATIAGMGADPAALQPVQMKVEISNPLDVEKTSPIRYPLPAEIKPDYVVNGGGLELKYDTEKNVHYLFKEDVVFAPRETKVFVVEMKDVWVLSDEKINALKTHTAKIQNLLANSEAKQSAEFLGKRITDKLNAVLESQKKPNVPADVHIGDYRSNCARLDEARKDIDRLERLIVQTGGQPGMTLSTRDIKIKEGGVIPAAGGRSDLPKPAEKVGAWRIIWVVIVFAGVISFLFFMLWWIQIKRKEQEKLLPIDMPRKSEVPK